MIRVVELMFVFGDAERMVWQARDFHKFLVHKFLRRYFGVDFRIWARRRREILRYFGAFLRGKHFKRIFSIVFRVVSVPDWYFSLPLCVDTGRIILTPLNDEISEFFSRGYVIFQISQNVWLGVVIFPTVLPF